MARLQTSVTSLNSPAITTLGVSHEAFHPFLTFPYRTIPVLELEFYFYSSSPPIKRNIKVIPKRAQPTTYTNDG